MASTVTGKTSYGVQDSFVVTVVDDTLRAVQSVALSPASTSIEIGGSTTLTITILPENATNKAVNWFVDDATVISLVSNGGEATVTGLKEGSAKVTVVSVDGGYTAEAIITVADMTIPVTSVKINSVATTTVRKNKTLQLAPIFTPANANYGTEVTWSSSNEASVKVDAETGLVTGIIAGGSARITLSTSNGKTYTITVTVVS